jgi:hypothetical protein
VAAGSPRTLGSRRRAASEGHRAEGVGAGLRAGVASTHVYLPQLLASRPLRYEVVGLLTPVG